MTGSPSLQTESRGEELTCFVSGRWTIDQAAAAEASLDQLPRRPDGIHRVVFRCSGLERIDTTGAWLLTRQGRLLERAGFAVDFTGFRDADFHIVEHIGEICPDDGQRTGRPGEPLSRRFEDIGRVTVGGVRLLGETVGFIGRIVITLTRCIVRPRHIRFSAVVSSMYHAGVTAIPIIVLMSFLVSVVIAYQGAAQLERFGAEVFSVQLTVVSMLREMGVLMTAIIVSGRSGSAFTAEIGVMKVREEIDAMYTMGLDPYEVLILPRIVALIIMLPLLTLLANLAGMIGGAATSVFILDISAEAFLREATEVLTPGNFWAGMLKAPIFAFLIGVTATFWGMQVAGSADSVGRLTTVSVVQSLFLVIAADVISTFINVNIGF